MIDRQIATDPHSTEGMIVQLDRLARIVGNIRIVVSALVAVVVIAFGAGAYFANIIGAAARLADDVTSVELRLATAEQQINAQKAAETETRQLMAASFESFASGMVPVGDLLPSTEPLVSGGGTKPMCSPGTVVIGLQLFKDDNGQRTVRIQCGKFGEVRVE